MTFGEWWKSIDKKFSLYAIPDEIKWFAENSWDAAVHEMMKQEKESNRSNLSLEKHD